MKTNPQHTKRGRRPGLIQTNSLKDLYKDEETHHPGSTFLWFTFPAEPRACGDLDNSIAGWNNRNEGQMRWWDFLPITVNLTTLPSHPVRNRFNMGVKNDILRNVWDIFVVQQHRGVTLTPAVSQLRVIFAQLWVTHVARDLIWQEMLLPGCTWRNTLDYILMSRQNKMQLKQLTEQKVRRFRVSLVSKQFVLFMNIPNEFSLL